MKLLLAAVCVGLAVLIASPNRVRADTSVNITITATGVAVLPPQGFTVTYINDGQVDITWTKPVGAINTMVRAAVGRYPVDRTDGYLVYYGAAEAVSDTAVSLDETATSVQYRAWSEKVGDLWSPYAEGLVEGIGMTLIAFVVLALGLTIAAFALRAGRAICATAAAGAWIVLAVYCYTKSTALWDVWYAMMLFGAIMTFACMLIPAVLREEKERLITDDEKYGEHKELILHQQEIQKDRERLDLAFGGPIKRRIRPSKFSRTGRL